MARAVSEAQLREETYQILLKIERALSNGSASVGSGGDRGSDRRGAGSGTNDSGSNTQSDAAQRRREALQNRTTQELEQTLDSLINSIEDLKNSVEGHEERLSDDRRQLLADQREEAQIAREIILEARRGEIEQSEIIQNSSRRLGRALSSLTEPVRANWNAFEDYNLSMNKSISAQSSMLAGMVEGSSLQNAAYDKYITKLLDASDTLSSFTNLGRELSSVQDLSEAIDELNKDGKVFEALLKEHGNQTSEYIESLYELEQATGNLTDHQREILEIARKTNMMDEHGRVQNVQAIRNHTNQIKADMIKMQEIAVKHMTIAKMTQSFHDKFGKYASALFGGKGPFGLFALGVMMLGDSIVKVYDQFTKAADIGMLGANDYLGSFARLKEAQVQLGISFEETAKIFQENRRMAYSVGDNVGDFADALDEGQKSLILLGMGNEDAAKTAVDFAKNATKAGIDITSNDKVRKAMKTQTEAYGRLKVLTGASASEFKALNDELFDAQSVQEQLNGIGRDEREVRMNAMFKLREDFVKLGLSAQSANKALISIQDLGKEKLADRFTQAAKFQQLAGVLGMKNAAQLGQIVRKGDRATADEKKELMEAAVEMQKRADVRRRGSYGDENIIQSLVGGLSGPLLAMMEQGREASKTTDALGKFAEKAFGRQTVDGDIKIPPWAATLIDIGHSIETVITDPIVKAIGGIALAAGGLLLLFRAGGSVIETFRSMKNSLFNIDKNTGSMSSSTGDDSSGGTAQERAERRRREESQRRRRGGVRNRTTPARPRAGNVSRLAGALKPTGFGVGALASGLAANAIIDNQTNPETGEVSTGGKLAAMASGAMSGASLGMLSGNPLVGLAGGVIGAGVGLYGASGGGEGSSDASPTSGISSSYPVGTNPPSIYSPQPSASTASRVTPIGGSTAGTSSSSSSNEADAPVIRLSKDTIAKLGNYLTTLNDTQTKSLNIEQDQLDMLAALVTASDEAYKNAKSLKPIPGHSSLFGRGGRYEYIN
jgi:hypothetical protein